MTPETLISITAAKGMSVDHIAGGGRPTWTAQEAAMAAKDLDERYFKAMLYEYALDDSVRGVLSVKLGFWATSRYEELRTLPSKSLHWPEKITNVDGWERRVAYVIYDLVELHFLEVRQPWRFIRQSNEPNLRRIILNVNETTWRRKLSPVYEEIRSEWRRWLSIAHWHMGPWLRNEAA